MAIFPLGEGTTWDILTGGMDNLLQGGVGGLLGTLIGVGGALFVARHTTKKELDKDRELAALAAGVEAAARLSSHLHDLRSHLEKVDETALLTNESWARKQYVAWEELQERFRRQVVEDGPVLPEHEEVNLANLIRELHRAYALTGDFDDPAPPLVEKNRAELFDPIVAHLDEALDSLRTYRRQYVKRKPS